MGGGGCGRIWVVGGQVLISRHEGWGARVEKGGYFYRSFGN